MPPPENKTEIKPEEMPHDTLSACKLGPELIDFR